VKKSEYLTTLCRFLQTTISSSGFYLRTGTKNPTIFLSKPEEISTSEQPGMSQKGILVYFMAKREYLICKKSKASESKVTARLHL
jgi:hypothetical protein